MNLGTRTPPAESRAILERALKAGLTCFDTANVYGNGASERVLGEVLHGVPHARVASKVGLLAQRGRPEGLSPARIQAALAESLERLRRDTLDVYYLHTPDRAVPMEETVGTMAQLVAQGRVKAWAVSNHASWEILEMFHHCDRHGLPRPRQSQVLLNVVVRQVEMEYARFAARHRLHTTVYNPLAGGVLARVPPPDARPDKGSRFDGNQRYLDRYWSSRVLQFAQDVRALAQRHGVTPLDVAYGWLMRHPAVDSILLGPASVAHLDAALESCARALPDALWKDLAALQRAFDGTDATYAR